jgi:hypothetical protein
MELLAFLGLLLALWLVVRSEDREREEDKHEDD